MRAFLLALTIFACAWPAAAAERYDALIARHSQANGVPEALVRRVILRESRYDAGAVGRGGAMGLMQIKHATARAMGYAGSARGLLDADTNLTYGVRYLAGAYRAARGDQARAFSLYQRGYYDVAKRQRLGLN
jgi:soluble lytic murein transglycosylase-like protein